jgi:large subunit ribosomal protein L21
MGARKIGGTSVGVAILLGFGGNPSGSVRVTQTALLGQPARLGGTAAPGVPSSHSDMYAIVEVSGKQFKVQQDDTLYVPRQTAEIGDTLTFDRVLLVSGDDIQVGQPTIAGATVTAMVLDHVKGDKLIVFKKKRRKGYRVKNGHRQPYTRISVETLNL